MFFILDVAIKTTTVKSGSVYLMGVRSLINYRKQYVIRSLMHNKELPKNVNRAIINNIGFNFNYADYFSMYKQTIANMKVSLGYTHSTINQIILYK